MDIKLGSGESLRIRFEDCEGELLLTFTEIPVEAGPHVIHCVVAGPGLAQEDVGEIKMVKALRVTRNGNYADLGLVLGEDTSRTRRSPRG